MNARDRIHRLFESGLTSYRLDGYLDAYRGEVLAEVQPDLDALHRIRQAAHWGDLAKIRQILAQTDATARQTALLIAIGNDPTGQWKPGRAIKTLREMGYHPVSPLTAAQDLAALAERGHLTAHDDGDIRWYQPTAVTP